MLLLINRVAMKRSSLRMIFKINLSFDLERPRLSYFEYTQMGRQLHGSEIRKAGRAEHCKSKKHMDYVNKIDINN